MCVVAAIPLVMAAVAAGVSAYGAKQSADAQSAAANYQAQVAANNQTIAQRNAQQAIDAGNAAATASQMQTAQRMGGIRAAAAASGLDPNVGSPLSLQSDTAKLGALDAMTIRSNAARQAYGFQVEGVSQQAQSTLDRMTASQAQTAGNIGMLSSAVGGASNVSSKWVGYQQQGLLQ